MNVFNKVYDHNWCPKKGIKLRDLLGYESKAKLDFNFIEKKGQRMNVLIEDMETVCHRFDLFNHEINTDYYEAYKEIRDNRAEIRNHLVTMQESMK